MIEPGWRVLRVFQHRGEVLAVGYKDNEPCPWTVVWFISSEALLPASLARCHQFWGTQEHTACGRAVAEVDRVLNRAGQ